jgi:hypothetical protein
MKQEKNELDNNQFIDFLNLIEKEICKNEDAITEVNHFNKKNQKEKQKKIPTEKIKTCTKKLRKTLKKLTTKKPKVKSQKTGKKQKSKKTLKNKGKSNKQKLITDSKELCHIRGESNTLPNSSCQKEYFHFESRKKKDLDNGSELGKEAKDIVIENDAFQKDNANAFPEIGGGSILIKEHEESEKNNKMDDGNSTPSENKNENNIGDSLPQQNIIKTLQSNPEKENFSQFGNNSEFNILQDLDSLIPSCDEDINFNFIIDVNSKS